MRLKARLASLQENPDLQNQATQESWELSPWYSDDDEEQTVVTDYLSGTATIEVLDSNDEVVLTEDVTIYKVTGVGRISLTSPRGRDNDKVLNEQSEDNRRGVFNLDEGKKQA